MKVRERWNEGKELKVRTEVNCGAGQRSQETQAHEYGYMEYERVCMFACVFEDGRYVQDHVSLYWAREAVDSAVSCISARNSHFLFPICNFLSLFILRPSLA